MFDRPLCLGAPYVMEVLTCSARSATGVVLSRSVLWGARRFSSRLVQVWQRGAMPGLVGTPWRLHSVTAFPVS